MNIYALSIDWETSGSSFSSLEDTTRDYQGISFGACIFDLDTFAIHDSIYHEIRFDPKYKWTLEAERIHGLTREYLSDKSEPEDAAVDLMNMVVKYFGTGSVVFAGHNVAFDIAFTKQLLEGLGIMPAVASRQLDTAGIGWVMFNEPKSEPLYQLLGLPPRQLHNALEDAIYTVQALQIMRGLSMTFLGDGA